MLVGWTIILSKYLQQMKIFSKEVIIWTHNWMNLNSRLVIICSFSSPNLVVMHDKDICLLLYIKCKVFIIIIYSLFFLILYKLIRILTSCTNHWSELTYIFISMLMKWNSNWSWFRLRLRIVDEYIMTIYHILVWS